MGNKLIRNFNLVNQNSDFDLTNSFFATKFNYNSVINTELMSDIALYGLYKCLYSTSGTIAVATNASTSSNCSLVCIEYQDVNNNHQVIYDTRYNNLYFSSTDVTSENVKILLSCFVQAVLIKNNTDGIFDSLFDCILFEQMTTTECTDVLKEYVKVFYTKLSSLIDSVTSAAYGWIYFDLNVNVPPTIASETLYAYSMMINGQTDFNVTNSIFSHFIIGRCSNDANIKKYENKDFVIDPNHKYSKLEKERMENNKLVEGYVPTETDRELVKRIYHSIKNNGRGPSIFLYGESGTGKSEMGKYFSKKLGLPYTFFCCSATTNESDMRGKPQGLGTMGGLVKFLKDAVKSVWNKDIKTSKSQEADEISYTLTEIVLACKYGWIIEIQEPTLIVNAGTLGFLNCVLDDNRTLILPNGEQIPVHPNTVFIFTTNLLYEGCNLLNNSLLSRMDYVINVKTPSLEENVTRIISRTGYKGDREDIVLLMRAVNEIKNIIFNNEIIQGICDVRTAIACTQDYMNTDCESWRKSARYTIEDKAVLEPGFAEQIKLKLDSILGEE